MSQVEDGKSAERYTPGNLKPSVKLRESLQEVDKCKEFFLKGGFTEYLNSVNQFYFEGKGRIVGPKPIIVTDVVQNTQADDEIEESDLLVLDDNARGGIKAFVEFKEKDSSSKVLNKLISITLKYKLEHNCFILSLYATCIEKYLEEESAIRIGKNSRKLFYLNPNTRCEKDIDDLLISFTGELLEARIL